MTTSNSSVPSTSTTSASLLLLDVLVQGTRDGVRAAVAAAATSLDSSSREGSGSNVEDSGSSGYTTLEYALFAVIAGILSFLTIAGNVLVMVSFKLDKQLQTISNYFLLSLAGQLMI